VFDQADAAGMYDVGFSYNTETDMEVPATLAIPKALLNELVAKNLATYDRIRDHYIYTLTPSISSS
jgi:hypothetical protein